MLRKLIPALLVLSFFLEIFFALQLYRDFFPDGKYCLIQELKTNKTKHHKLCSDPIVIRTKYPYLIIWDEHHDRSYDHGIHVVQPESWPNVVDLKKSKSEEDRELHFTLHNTSFHLYHQRHHHLQRTSMNFTLKLKDGLLLVHSVAYKRVQTSSTEHYCTMNNLVPGKWKYDSTFVIRSDDKWQNCPTIYTPLYERYWYCASSFHALQYFPDSNCHILPLRQSLFLLYQSFYVEGLITNSTDKPYFFFMGDSLVLQLSATARCELHSNANMILSQYQYHISSSVHSLGYQVFGKWNQFLRSDLPCSLSCADETYLKTEGSKKDIRYELSPCGGCPNGNISSRSPFTHPELFYMLHVIPLSVRVLVLDAGAWFISDNVRGEDSNVVYKETLEALIPHLVYFQKQRNYEVDIYFLPLPGVDPSLAKSPSHEWSKYEEKNRILYSLFSLQSLSVHNITITLLPNNKIFHRKNLINGISNYFLPDNLHYCAPGAFSPDSYLFELIVHNHVVKKLREKLG